MHAQINVLIKFIFLLIHFIYLKKNLPINFMYKRCAFQVVDIIKFIIIIINT